MEAGLAPPHQVAFLPVVLNLRADVNEPRAVRIPSHALSG